MRKVYGYEMTPTKAKPAAGDRGLERFLEITGWRPVEGADHVRGFLSLILSRADIVVHNVPLLEANGRRWIGLPGRRFKLADGKMFYQPLFEFRSAAAQRRFNREAMAAAEIFLRARGQW
jgi:hypothetical protein